MPHDLVDTGADGLGKAAVPNGKALYSHIYDDYDAVYDVLKHRSTPN